MILSTHIRVQSKFQRTSQSQEKPHSFLRSVLSILRIYTEDHLSLITKIKSMIILIIKIIKGGILENSSMKSCKMAEVRIICLEIENR